MVTHILTNMLNELSNNFISELEPLLRIASGLMTGFVMIKLIKMQIQVVKNVRECKVVDKGYKVIRTFFKLTDFDLATLIVFLFACYFLRELFMSSKFFSAEMAVIFLGAITLTIKNMVLDKVIINRYILLSILNSNSGTSEQIIEASNGKLEIEDFYQHVTPLLKTEIVSNYLEGQLLEAKVIYSITPKGVNHYLDYLNIEHNNLVREKHHLERKVSMKPDIEADLAYKEICERQETVRKEIQTIQKSQIVLSS